MGEQCSEDLEGLLRSQPRRGPGLLQEVEGSTAGTPPSLDAQTASRLKKRTQEDTLLLQTHIEQNYKFVLSGREVLSTIFCDYRGTPTMTGLLPSML